MSESMVIEVAIGLVLVYLIFSLFCSAVNEWIARLLGLRASGLRHGINELFIDQSQAVDSPANVRAKKFTDAFHAEPLIEALKPSKSPTLRRAFARYPSYIPSATFAQTVLKLTADSTSPGSPGVGLRSTLKQPTRANPTAGDDVPSVIRDLLEPVDGDGVAMQHRLEAWFNSSMDRVGGWYKRRAQAYLFIIAVLIAVFFNVDTFAIVSQLANEPLVRAALVKQAENIVQQPAPVAPAPNVLNAPVGDTAAARKAQHVADSITKQRILDLQRAGVSVGWDQPCSLRMRFARSLGWSSTPAPCNSTGASLIGLFATAIALSFGAPFWFDALNKLVNLRQTGSPPAQSGAKR